ncbi:unnamed protein product, partial [Ectocarpus sp. 12 AP-2014]
MEPKVIGDWFSPNEATSAFIGGVIETPHDNTARTSTEARPMGTTTTPTAVPRISTRKEFREKRGKNEPKKTNNKMSHQHALFVSARRRIITLKLPTSRTDASRHHRTRKTTLVLVYADRYGLRLSRCR